MSAAPSTPIERWLFAPAPAERLAALRVLCGLFTVTYLLVRLPVFLTLADQPRSRYEPVGVLALLDGPPPRGLVTAIVTACLVLGAAFTAGVFFRFTGPSFAILVLLVTTYHSSWGQLLWFENLVVLHLLIVGVSRSSDALSVDAAQARRGPRASAESRYGWPVRLAAIVTVATYVIAGIAKLRIGGVGWLAGETVRNHVAYSAVRLEALGASPPPLAGATLEHAWLFTPLALVTMVVELSAPVALLGGWIRNAWVAAAWVMHAGIAALMFVVFPYPLFLVAFVPFYRVERALPRSHSHTTAPVDPGSGVRRRWS